MSPWPARTALADEVVTRLVAAFAAAADPERAEPMAAYMRHQFRFFGLPSPERRRATGAALRGLPAPDEADAVAVTLLCWDRDERELQYAGAEYLCHHIGRCGPAVLGPLEKLITTKSWWDTGDLLCRHGAGEVVRRFPAERAVMDRWIVSDDIWLARSAILHQERWGVATDRELLFAYCARRAADTEFFIRKAIGWALREYSKTDAAAVREFVADHHGQLSPLSTREALKWLNRKERG
jgi:3-methyladenine DNA glycosylase AlkD